MYAEETPDYWRPGQSFPEVPDRLNNFLIPREGDDCWVEEDWSPYPINRVWEYLQWLEGVRFQRFACVKLTLVVDKLPMWGFGVGPL